MTETMRRMTRAKEWVAEMLSREAGPDALAYHLALLLKRERADERKRCAAEMRLWTVDPEVADKVDEKAVATVRAVSISVEHGWPNFDGLDELVDAEIQRTPQATPTKEGK